MKRPRGFSMVEVVVATGLLVLSASAVTGLVLASQGGFAASRLRTAAHAAAAELVAQARALPFFAEDPAGAESTAVCSSAVARLFPHALREKNTTAAFYVWHDEGECREGAFVTETPAACGSLRTVARFVCATRSGWQPVSISRLEGFAVWSQPVPPAPALLVEVTALDSHRPGRPLCTMVAVIDGEAVLHGASPSLSPSSSPSRP
jgi:type II secretory pathway pseudopilin PulG